MINTTLPAQEKEIYEENKLVVKKRDIAVKIDTSILAEQRWEQHFPELAKKETIFAYAERIQKNALTDVARILASFKSLYCFIVSDELPDFNSFLQMFDLADEKYLSALAKKIKDIFNLILTSSAGDGKN